MTSEFILLCVDKHNKPMQTILRNGASATVLIFRLNFRHGQLTRANILTFNVVYTFYDLVFALLHKYRLSLVLGKLILFQSMLKLVHKRTNCKNVFFTSWINAIFSLYSLFMATKASCTYVCIGNFILCFFVVFFRNEHTFCMLLLM